MQRRHFLGTLALAGIAAPPLVGRPSPIHPAPLTPFNLSGLAPATFRQRWSAGLGAAQRGTWLYCPHGSTDPFLAWYPGDDQVSAWAIDVSTLPNREHPMVRSFVHEAARRGKPVRFL